MPTIVANFVSSISTKKTGDFASKMWASYTQLNPGVYSEAIATEFKRRMKPDYVENLVPNGGGLNSLDWVDTNADGLADGWSTNGNFTTTIVTGNGFSNRAQRAVAIATGNAYITLNPPFLWQIGISYTITVSYRSSSSIVFAPDGSRTFPPNTGNATTVTFTIIPTLTFFFVYARLPGSAMSGDWIEIDNLTITPTVSQNYFTTFGPSGLNKTTADWIYLLTTSGNITSRNITKSGALLKWNLDGVTVTQNSLPAYTKGANAGVVTMTSTDGWNGVTAFALNVNSFTGVHPNFNTQNVTSFNTSANLLTGRAGSLYATNKMSSANISGNLWTTAMVDAELAYYNTMFAVTPPIKNLTLNLSGATMGIPTGAGSNPDYLGIIAKVQAAGFIPTISTRTS